MRFDYDVWMTIHNMKLGVGEVGLIIITTNFGARCAPCSAPKLYMMATAITNRMM